MLLSDRQRVELTLPAQMMLAIMMAGVEKTNQNEEFKEIKRLLIVAGTDPIEDLRPAKAQNKIIARASRLNVMLHDKLVEKDMPVSDLGIIFFHVIRHIIEAEYLQYAEGSPIDLSLQAFMNSLEERASIEGVNAKAEEKAKYALKLLQAEGYYQGVNPE